MTEQSFDYLGRKCMASDTLWALDGPPVTLREVCERLGPSLYHALVTYVTTLVAGLHDIEFFETVNAEGNWVGRCGRTDRAFYIAKVMRSFGDPGYIGARTAKRKDAAS